MRLESTVILNKKHCAERSKWNHICTDKSFLRNCKRGLEITISIIKEEHGALGKFMTVESNCIFNMWWHECPNMFNAMLTSVELINIYFVIYEKNLALSQTNKNAALHKKIIYLS